MVARQQKGARPKHVPKRLCVACRESSAKRQLVRIVRTPQGTVEVDTTGKRSGRGAYICPRSSCWELALNKGRLERALKTAIAPADKESLIAYKAAQKFAE